MRRKWIKFMIMMFGILFEKLFFIFLIRGKRQVYIKSSPIRRNEN